MQLNYITIITVIITLSYYNDKRHRDSYINFLLVELTLLMISRTKEQEKNILQSWNTTRISLITTEILYK
jgi:hypothetical protein